MEIRRAGSGGLGESFLIESDAHATHAGHRVEDRLRRGEVETLDDALDQREVHAADEVLVIAHQSMERTVAEPHLTACGLGLVSLSGERVHHPGEKTLPAGS